LVHYRLPSDNIEQNLKYTILQNYIAFDQLEKPYKFATAVAMFGLKLRESKYFPDVDWEAIKKVAVSGAVSGDFLQSQFIEMVDKAKSIYAEKKRKWRRNKD